MSNYFYGAPGLGPKEVKKDGKDAIQKVPRVNDSIPILSGPWAELARSKEALAATSQSPDIAKSWAPTSEDLEMVCHYFIQGNCRYGASCRHKHDINALGEIVR
jgi:hypothetical protein